MRVAAGAVARQVLGAGLVFAARWSLGPHAHRPARWDWDAVGRNPFFCPDPVAAARWETYLDEVRKAGSSSGAVIEVVAEGVPPGLGAPVYGKLDADLAAALMSINAVKGVEIGDGFAAAELHGRGQCRRDAHGRRHGALRSNHAGGILGGISTGQPVVARFAVKPTSSILTPRAHGGPTATNRDHHQGPSRSVRRHPRRAGRRGDAGLRAGRPSAAHRAQNPYAPDSRAAAAELTKWRRTA